jgi:hypothetical protein
MHKLKLISDGSAQCQVFGYQEFFDTYVSLSHTNPEITVPCVGLPDILVKNNLKIITKQ